MLLSLQKGGIHMVAEGRQNDQLSLHQGLACLCGLLNSQGLQALHSEEKQSKWRVRSKQAMLVFANTAFTVTCRLTIPSNPCVLCRRKHAVLTTELFEVHRLRKVLSVCMPTHPQVTQLVQACVWWLWCKKWQCGCVLQRWVNNKVNKHNCTQWSGTTPGDNGGIWIHDLRVVKPVRRWFTQVCVWQTVIADRVLFHIYFPLYTSNCDKYVCMYVVCKEARVGTVLV